MARSKEVAKTIIAVLPVVVAAAAERPAGARSHSQLGGHVASKVVA